MRVYDQEGTALREFDEHTGPIAAIAFSPTDPDLLLSGSLDHTARLWNVRSGECLHLFRHQAAVKSVAFSPDGNLIVTAALDRRAKVWSTTSFEEVGVWSHPDEVVQASFLPSGAYVVTFCRDGGVRLSSPSGQPVLSLMRPWPSTGGSISGDGNLILGASTGGTLWCLVWPELPIFLGHGAACHCVRFSSDGQVVTCSDDGTVRFWSRDGREDIDRRVRCPGPVRHFDLSPDGRHLAWIDDRKTLRIRDLTGPNRSDPSRDLVRPSPGNDSYLRVRFSPDGDRLLIANSAATGGAVVMGIEGEVLADLRHEPVGSCLCAVFEPHGPRIATVGSKPRTANVWADLNATEPVVLRHEGYSYVTSVAWTRDASRLVTLQNGGMVRFWDVDAEQVVWQHPDTSHGANWLALSPVDDRLFLTCHYEAVYLWSTESADPLMVLREPQGWMTWATFDPEGRHVLTASEHGFVRTWPLDVEELKQIAEERLRQHR
ncbi:MAG: WD40 repeat domain-containing protein [Planctomycetes bacterium]|nr:WD40 repeat domain-containing protein [Planctomycetota bacterium]